MSITTAKRWADRCRAQGKFGMADRSSRPRRCRHQTSRHTKRRVLGLRVARLRPPMTRLDTETRRKLREMGATALLETFEARDEALMLDMGFEDQVKLVVDEARSSFTHAKVEGMIRRAGLRYPNADPRRLDLLTAVGLDQGVIARLGTCSFIERYRNVAIQSFSGSGKSYLGLGRGLAQDKPLS